MRAGAPLRRSTKPSARARPDTPSPSRSRTTRRRFRSRRCLTCTLRSHTTRRELNRQGPDEGSQYRSEIFYTTDAQRAEAIATIARLQQTHVFTSPIVTVVAPLRGFYRAEAYHQEFALHNPHDPYIVFNDLPKLKVLRADFPELIKANPPFPA